MANAWNEALGAWMAYWGEGRALGLFALGLVLLMGLGLRRKLDKAGRALLVFALLGLLAFFFPPTALLGQKLAGAGVYWRFLWILPIFPVMGYLPAWICLQVKKRFPGLVAGLAALVLAALVTFTGVNAFSRDNYARFHNYQQVPDEVASLCSQIAARNPDPDALVAADDYIASYIRVYDPSLKMPYGRATHGRISGNALLVYRQLMAYPNTNYRYLARKAQRAKITYLIMQNPGKKGRRRLKKAGFLLVGQAGAYYLFEKKPF